MNIYLTDCTGVHMELWALDVWFAKNKRGDNRVGSEIFHCNGSHTQHKWMSKHVWKAQGWRLRTQSDNISSI
jgi:hypothetical protein